MTYWRTCPGCGFSKAFEVGERLCPPCVERGYTVPEPAGLVEYPFDAPVRARFLDGDQAYDALEHELELELARARGDLLDVEIRHVEGT